MLDGRGIEEEEEFAVDDGDLFGAGDPGHEESGALDDDTGEDDEEDLGEDGGAEEGELDDEGDEESGEDGDEEDGEEEPTEEEGEDLAARVKILEQQLETSRSLADLGRMALQQGIQPQAMQQPHAAQQPKVDPEVRTGLQVLFDSSLKHEDKVAQLQRLNPTAQAEALDRYRAWERRTADLALDEDAYLEQRLAGAIERRLAEALRPIQFRQFWGDVIDRHQLDPDAAEYVYAKSRQGMTVDDAVALYRATQQAGEAERKSQKVAARERDQKAAKKAARARSSRGTNKRRRSRKVNLDRIPDEEIADHLASLEKAGEEIQMPPGYEDYDPAF